MGVWIAAGLSAVGLVLLLLVLRRLASVGKDEAGQTIREEIRPLREEMSQSARDLREEVGRGQQRTTDTLVSAVSELGRAQANRLESVTRTIQGLTQSNETRLETVRTAVDQRLQTLQENNEKKLEQMRRTVDVQLQSTLEKRLGESFKLVSERLEAVQRGLGEMQDLATGVGDLKRVLTNVKARGTWGEVQLGALLQQVLTPEQFDTNVPVKGNSSEKVEYAIRLPGNDVDPGSCVWLPIDSKFPLEDYDRLVEAAEAADAEAVRKATEALLRTVRGEAKKISEKYIEPPRTTDFAILFLPTEGLYAEVLRQPGQVEELQQRFRVVVAGPTTLSAILSSLRMGFRTLAIQKRSSEVWEILAAVKTEFDKFSGVLEKVKRQLNTASKTIEDTGVRTRAMARKLQTVEKLPSEEAAAKLGLSEAVPMIDLDESEDSPASESG